MHLEVLPTVEDAARRGADEIAARIEQAVELHGRATLALSGGASPLPLLRELARRKLDWSVVHVFQVDERLAPRGDPARNLTALEDVLVSHGPLPRHQLHPIPLDGGRDPARVVADYEAELSDVAGSPPLLDLVHLGIGGDGHTASLFPGDAALKVQDRTVVLTDEHAGYRRITLTLPVLNGAACVLWFATGAAKAAVIARLVSGGWGAPAGQVQRDRALVVIDRDAAK